MSPPGQQHPARPDTERGRDDRASGPVFILRATGEGETDDARQGMLHQVEEALASLWLCMARVGHTRFQEEIEEVSDECFDSRRAPHGEAVRRSHDLFERVHAEYTEEIQKRIGHKLPPCPHCKGKE